MKNIYIDLHVIQTVPPSCVNRDDTNSPKSAIYGGVHRARVSSQAWKHAMRLMFREHIDSLALGRRTKDLAAYVLAQIADELPIGKEETKSKAREVINLASADAKKPIIPDATYNDIKKVVKEAVKEWNNAGDTESEAQLIEELQSVLTCFNLAIQDAKKANDIFKATDAAIVAVSDDKGSEQRIAFERDVQSALLSSPLLEALTDTASDALFFIGKQEAINVANLTLAYINTGQKPSKDRVREAMNYYPGGGGPSCFAVDVALFGRMVAKAPELNVDASAQVAHAISTHRVEREFDFFTAMDELTPPHRTGAEMIGDIAFNSSTLYRYAT
ncbi:MAG: type I-E CRISPR-associated protein Cas7/Cse4/CasC, partial [Clostridiales Family XIII bacterium]|nr:type I-E CRISPR-associated protein Cas7/Cse4/CasC [Clostridiales Family XIII bacterium]